MDETDPAEFRAYWEAFVAFEEAAVDTAPAEIKDDWELKVESQSTMNAVFEKYEFDVAAMMESGTPEEEAAFEAPPDVQAGQDRILAYESEVCGAPIESVDAPILAVTFSPDGARLATGTSAGVVQQWSVSTHQPVGAALKGHTGPVGGVTYSPDGTLLASSTLGFSRHRLWDAKTGGGRGPGARQLADTVDVLDVQPRALPGESAGLLPRWPLGRRSELRRHHIDLGSRTGPLACGCVRARRAQPHGRGVGPVHGSTRLPAVLSVRTHCWSWIWWAACGQFWWPRTSRSGVQ